MNLIAVVTLIFKLTEISWR